MAYQSQQASPSPLHIDAPKSFQSDNMTTSNETIPTNQNTNNNHAVKQRPPHPRLGRRLQRRKCAVGSSATEPAWLLSQPHGSASPRYNRQLPRCSQCALICRSGQSPRRTNTYKTRRASQKSPWKAQRISPVIQHVEPSLYACKSLSITQSQIMPRRSTRLIHDWDDGFNNGYPEWTPLYPDWTPIINRNYGYVRDIPPLRRPGRPGRRCGAHGDAISMEPSAGQGARRAGEWSSRAPRWLGEAWGRR
ncbi:hypothetical protein PSPO01_03102 [Paraphaeosphaeria sporulosa]